MTYKAPPDLAAKHPIPKVIPLIEKNVQRYEEELREGYRRLQLRAEAADRLGAVPDFDRWAFTLVDAVFHDMLEAEVDHATPRAYTEEVGRRLAMKIKWSIQEAGIQRHHH